MIPYNYKNRLAPVNPWNYQIPRVQNRFGLDQQTPTVPPPQTYQLPQDKFGVNNPLQPAPEAPAPPDFASEYSKITGSRPNRLAYQQAVEQGAPEIRNSNWARLGAALAAGLTGAGNPRDPTGAYNLGMSALQEPQRRSDLKYQQKIKGLEQLSQFEDSDKALEIKALEERMQDWYNQQAERRAESGEKRAVSAEGRAVSAEDRATKLNDIQIKHITQQMDKENTDRWTNPMDGITYERNPQGVIRQVGKEALTPAEKAAAAGEEEKSREAAREPGRKAERDAEYKKAIDVAREGTTRATTVQGMKSQAQLDAIRERNKKVTNSFKAGDTGKQIYIDLTNEFATNPELVGEDLHDYIDIAEGPGGNSIIQAKPPRTFGPITIPDSPATLGIKQMIRDAIAKSIANSKNKGTNEQGGLSAPGEIDKQKWIPDPNNPNNTIANPNYGKVKKG